MNHLINLSNDLAAVVAGAENFTVAVHGRPRVPSSGVLWRPGIVVTAEHALKQDENLKVTLPGGETVAATVAGRDPGTDLAVLKVDSAAAGPPFAPTGDLHTGNLILAVGRSTDNKITATLGVLSAIGPAWRTWRGGAVDRYLRLDVTLYPGSSGSAVLDAQGRVIGIATSALSRIAGVALPVSTVNRVVDTLLARGTVSRGYLGVGLQPLLLPEHLKSTLGLSGKTAVIVLSVEPEGPAGQAGVFIGDIVVELGGTKVEDTDDVQQAIETAGAGHTLKAAIIRAGALTHVDLVVGERPKKSSREEE